MYLDILVQIVIMLTFNCIDFQLRIIIYLLSVSDLLLKNLLFFLYIYKNYKSFIIYIYMHVHNIYNTYINIYNRENVIV